MIPEIFKPVKDYEGIYEISNHGRLKSLNRIDIRGQKRKERIMTAGIDNDGYEIIVMSKDRVRSTTAIHRLVARHFITPVEGKTQVNHCDGVKTNNLSNNLEWCTNKENQQHSRRIGLHPEIAETHKAATLTNNVVLEIANEKGRNTVISKKYNTTPLIVGRIRTGRTWGSITGIIYIKKKFK